MKRLSLRDRVTILSALALAVGLGVMTFGVYTLVGHRLDADESNALRERVDAQLSTLAFSGGWLTVRDAPDDEALDRHAWVYDQSGKAIQRPPSPPDVQAAADDIARRSGDRGGAERDLHDNVRLRSAALRDDSGRVRATVVVGLDLQPYDDTEHLVGLATLGIDLLVLLGGTLLVRAAVQRALRPVAEMTERAADWSAHDLDRRFHLGEPHDELTALAATLDGLLTRISSSIQHEQRFSAEIAHELRTPLAGVRGEAELALRDRSLPDTAREGFERVLRGAQRMEGVINTLLAAARGAAGASGQDSCDAHAATQAVTEALRPAAERSGVQLTVTSEARRVRVGAEENLVAQALQPLLDNAIRHAETRVSVTIGRENGEVVFRVVDDGPGPPAATDVLFEPGASSVGGAGLGLPLARRLARSCGGDVDAGPGERVGFELRLPAVV